MTTEDLLGKFGCVEFEDMASKIYNHLEKPREIKLTFQGYPYLKEEGIKGCFYPGDIFEEKWELIMFSCFANAGWVEHIWFPKGWFRFSKSFWERMERDK